MKQSIYKAMMYGGISELCGEVDLYGDPVERPKAKYPYSYSPYVQYRNGDNEEITNTVYSDRLYQWDPQKFNSLCRKYFGNTGQSFGTKPNSLIEKFLADYFGNPNLKLIVKMEGANMSSGYPYWVFCTGSKEINNESKK